MSPLIPFKLNSLAQVSVPSFCTMNVSVSDITESVSNKTVTNKPASSSDLSYTEVARVSPPSAVTHSTQTSSPKNNKRQNKSSSPPGWSSVNAGHQTGHVAQAAPLVTPSIFSPAQNSAVVNSTAPSCNDTCLAAVPPRKGIFVLRLEPGTFAGNIKSYLPAKIPSVNLKRVSIFKLAPPQFRAISPFKMLVPTENIDMLLNKPLRPVGSLIKEFIPRNGARNIKAIVLSPSKN
ncbi:uncharacterized protein LOC119642343 [Glossina fuscipes]|uniref:Uncharacterized protein LOC119642343 n=1 Tax=Glossina fuscipes TaxID=7396 RepID=A0A9C6DZ45_9MUSC|nr:uncharacterized protein LOC119642343 [Glossina fuscipes]XP_037897408.1 uncharacterized protein LOC119642343 [Glossina fuscipes]